MHAKLYNVLFDIADRDETVAAWVELYERAGLSEEDLLSEVMRYLYADTACAKTLTRTLLDNWPTPLPLPLVTR